MLRTVIVLFFISLIGEEIIISQEIGLEKLKDYTIMSNYYSRD